MFWGGRRSRLRCREGRSWRGLLRCGRETGMLLVGRELNINEKVIVCQRCSWRGIGVELSTGLAQVTSMPMYFYAFRCPDCLSFDLARRGKLLPFRRRPTIADENERGTPAKSKHAMS